MVGGWNMDIYMCVNVLSFDLAISQSRNPPSPSPLTPNQHPPKQTKPTTHDVGARRPAGGARPQRGEGPGAAPSQDGGPGQCCERVRVCVYLAGVDIYVCVGVENIYFIYT